jgi:hypothetical protein
MLASACAKKHGGRGGLTALAPKPGQDGGERRIAVIAHEQPDWDDGLTPTVPAGTRPVAEVMRYAECRRVHRRTIGREHRENKETGSGSKWPLRLSRVAQFPAGLSRN